MKKELLMLNKFRKKFMGKYYKPLTIKDLIELMTQESVLPYKYHYNNEVIGYATLSFAKTLTRKVMVIEDLIIDKDHVGVGHGTELMKELLEVAKSRKVDCVEVCTKRTNKIALNLYKKFKFKDRKNIALRLWLK